MTETRPEQYRYWGHIDPRGREKPAIVALAGPQAAAPPTSSNVVEMRLYDPIDSFGGDWGVSAKEFAAAVDVLPEGTSEIRLHINSPGGEAFEALAMLNTLRQHPARVVAIVDGLAASAASFLAAGADELVMGRNTELMVHEPRLVAIGTAADMADAGVRLDKLAVDMAEIYAEKAGGDVQAWRGVMRDEVWYSAQEAVDAGLADSVQSKAEPAGEPDAAASAKARWDLTVFAHAGRGDAPAPPMAAAPVVPVPTEPAAPADEPVLPAVEPVVPVSTPPVETPAVVPAPEPPAEPGPTPTQEEDGMADLKEGLRQRLGLTEDVGDDDYLAAVDEALAERAEAPAASVGGVTPPAGYMLVPTAAWEQAQTAMAAGVKAQTDNVHIERERVLADARDKGRILPHAASLDSWRKQYDRDPSGITAYLAQAPQIVPVASLGYAGGAESEADQSEKAMFAAMARDLGVSVEELSRG